MHISSTMLLPRYSPGSPSFAEAAHTPSTRPTSPSEEGPRCPISWATLADLTPQERHLAADGRLYNTEALKTWLLRYDYSPVDRSCSLLEDVPRLWPEDRALTPAQRRRAWLRNYTTALPRTWDQEVELERMETERVLLLCAVAGVGMTAALLGPAVGRLSAEGQSLLEGVHKNCAMLFFCGWTVERGPRLLRRAARWYVAQEPPGQQVRRLTAREKQRLAEAASQDTRSLP
jgi:hypothetical protein